MLQSRVNLLRAVARAHNEQGGQSIVELSLMLPILVFLLIGGADLARAFAIQLAVQNGARAGAESYAIDSTPTITEARAAAIAEMNRTPTVSATGGSCSGTPPTDCVTVSETLSDGTTACPVHPPVLATPCYVTVRVQYRFTTTIPWPLIPNTADFDRTTQFRMFY